VPGSRVPLFRPPPRQALGRPAGGVKLSAKLPGGSGVSGDVER
jgi:hypothetical protein